MKYFAILKDSFREAIDSKVLYVMIGLSALVILFVATLSFKPLPAEKTMGKIVDGTLNAIMSKFRPENTDFEHQNKRIQGDDVGLLTLKKVEVLRGAPDSPDSDYLLTVAMPFGTVEETKAAQAQPAASIARIEKLLAQAADLDLIRVGEVRIAPDGDAKPDEDRKLLFQITTYPTAGTRRIWFSEPSLFFGSVPLGESLSFPLGIQLYGLADTIIGIGSWVAILTGVIITSFFIPNMLRKGTVDLLLAKPIHRSMLLLYKFIGGLSFIFLNNCFAILGMWLVLGWRSGIWANWFLLLIPILTFFFAILYAVSTLFGVMTRSTVAAILITCGAWFLFFLVGTAYQLFETMEKVEAKKKLPPEEQKWTNNTFGKVVRVLHAVTPRTSDLSYLSSLLIMTDFLTGDLAASNKLTSTKMNWGESLLVSGIFIALMLALACWWFATKDY